jgi:hypothetical protein
MADEQLNNSGQTLLVVMLFLKNGCEHGGTHVSLISSHSAIYYKSPRRVIVCSKKNGCPPDAL